jgi:hypothetical protein
LSNKINTVKKITESLLLISKEVVTEANAEKTGIMTRIPDHNTISKHLVHPSKLWQTPNIWKQ